MEGTYTNTFACLFSQRALAFQIQNMLITIQEHIQASKIPNAIHKTCRFKTELITFLQFREHA